MLTAVIQLGVLAVTLLFLHFIIRPKQMLLILSMVSAVVLLLEVSSVFFTGELINYRIYAHLDIHSVLGFYRHYAVHYLIFLFLLIVLTATYYYLSLKASVLDVKRGYLGAFIAALIVAMVQPGGVLREFYDIFRITHAEKVSFRKALENVGINPDDYVLPKDVTATAGKNIIVISLESLESGYLTDSFPGVASNLRNLSNRWTYYENFKEGVGSDWTAGAIYTMLTGVPAYFKYPQNETFQGAWSSRLTGLTDVLSTAGYESVYMMGNPEFGGTRDMLTMYGVEVISERNFPGKYQTTEWGLQDMDLFSEVESKVRLLAESKKPFALFMSTVSTHFPDGIYDPRIEEHVTPEVNKLESMVKAVDFRLGRLISQLNELSLLDNTVIFIMPDHNLMGTTGEVIEKLSKEGRGLFLLTSAEPGDLSISPDKRIYHLDLANLILSAANIETNARFLSDYLDRDNIETYLGRYSEEIAQLNDAAISRETFADDLLVSLNKPGVSVSSGGVSVSLEKSDMPINTYVVVFSEHMNLLLAKNVQNADGKVLYDNSNRLIFLWVKTDEQTKQISALLQNGYLQAEFSESLSVNIDRQLIQMFVADLQYRRTQGEISRHAYQEERYIAHAGGAIDGKPYTNSLEALDNSYRKGFRLFELDIIETSDGNLVAAHDWKSWSEMTGYPGDLPPTHEQFMQQEIFGKYTPMDMDRINAWFAEHHDAILVTDKINSPGKVAGEFIDNSRLRMELFTWDAVLSATKINPEIAMPNLNVFASTQLKPLELLRKHDIRLLAASRQAIASNREFFVDLMKNGIRTYVFHIEDELYTFCKDMDYVFGMYADTWDFPTEVHCQ